MEQFIYTVDQAATALGFKRAHLYELTANGMLAFFKDGEKRYITKSSLEDYAHWCYEASSPRVEGEYG